MASGPKYRTLRVSDFQCLDGEGRPISQVTSQTIEAIDPLTEFPYVFGTPHVMAVNGLAGCAPTPVTERGEGRWGCQIRILGQLGKQQRTTITYKTQFDYSTPPSPVLRRYTGPGYDELEMVVLFPAERPPMTAHWGEWVGLYENAPVIDGSVVDLALQPTDISGGGLVARHHVVDLPPNKLIGIFWKW
jgi:hypothetical protein